MSNKKEWIITLWAEDYGTMFIVKKRGEKLKANTSFDKAIKFDKKEGNRILKILQNGKHSHNDFLLEEYNEDLYF